ncbi:MAG: PIG-L deacetylase family protein [Segetibacter sp.]
MKKNRSRRNFIGLSAMGLGELVFSASGAPDKKINALAIPENPLKKLNIICAGAHPGDPEFGCGGTMAKFSKAGHNVTFLYLTRGEAGDPNKTYAESAAIRTKEAEVACNALHVTPQFAGQIDGNTVLSNEKNAEMMKIIALEKPDMVFTQWPLDTHPDHQVTGLVILNAWTKMDRRFDLYFYEVNTGSETMSFVPTVYVDITNVRDVKKIAMYAHKTQDPVNTYNSFFQQMEDFRGLEAGVKAAEAFIHFKTKAARANILTP